MNHERNAVQDSSRCGRMLARRWAIAALYREPSDYGVPDLPDWTSGRDADGRMALAADAADEPFISAENPVAVKR